MLKQMGRILIFIITTIVFSSCGTQSRLFELSNQNINQDSLQNVFSSYKFPPLSPGDKISISVWGHDELSIGSINGNHVSNESTGRWLLIDDNGEVNLPRLGRQKLSGYSIREVNYFLEEKYSAFLKQPIVNVKVLNHYITILGEVRNPGKYLLDSDQEKIVEAIGVAGGLSDYAKADDIELIRNINDQTYKLDLNFNDLAQYDQKNINLIPGDVIYVVAGKSKEADKGLQKAGIITSILTGVAVVVSLLVK